jgi:hypothetical protein
MSHRRTRPFWLLVAAVAAVVLLAASTANASAPLQFGPFTDTYDFIGMNCDGFDIRIQGSETQRFTVFFDNSGDVARVVKHDSAPRDTLTNTVTGEAIVVRAEFDETMTPIPGIDEGTKTIVGFRYLVDEPGVGATVRDVGRIVYGDFEQTIVLWEAGEHDLALDSSFEPTFCPLLA